MDWLAELTAGEKIQLFGAVGAWLAAIATFSAAIIALSLGRESRKTSAKVTLTYRFYHKVNGLDLFWPNARNNSEITPIPGIFFEIYNKGIPKLTCSTIYLCLRPTRQGMFIQPEITFPNYLGIEPIELQHRRTVFISLYDLIPYIEEAKNKGSNFLIKHRLYFSISFGDTYYRLKFPKEAYSAIEKLTDKDV